jgi:hypothetical protein
VQLGIDALGWQGALFAMAAVAIAVIPLALPLADRPPPRAEGRPVGAGVALKEALSTGHFWCLFWGFFVCGVHVSFLGASS